MRWVEYFRNLPHQVKLKSKDENTQIGAIIVGKDKEIVSTGYNSFPRGLKDYEKERQERPEKYYWFEHTERNFNIQWFSRIGVSTKGCTMYLSCGVPFRLSRGIINSGIIRIFCERGDVTKSKHWEENYDRSWTMLERNGIDIQFYDDDFYG